MGLVKKWQIEKSNTLNLINNLAEVRDDAITSAKISSSSIAVSEPVALNQGLNLFPDSNYMKGNVVVVLPSGLSGTSYLACNNVAKGKTLTTNRTDLTIVSPGSVTDENFDSYTYLEIALSTDPHPDDWWELDLGDVYTGLLLCKVRCDLGTGGDTEKISISTNGTDWTDIATIPDNVVTVVKGVYTFRYIRTIILVEKAEDYAPRVFWYEIALFNKFDSADTYPANLIIAPETYGAQLFCIDVPQSTDALIGTSFRLRD